MKQKISMKQEQVFDFNSGNFIQDFPHNSSLPVWVKRVIQDTKYLNHIDLVKMPCHSNIKEHTHSLNNVEIYIIIEGQGIMTLEEEKFEVEAGSVIVNQPGGTHGLKNIGETELKLLVIEVPRSYKTVQLQPEGLLSKEVSVPSHPQKSNIVIISPKLYGICNSDIKEIQGNRLLRSDFGHELVGEVKFADPSISLVPGDIVCFNPHSPVERNSGFTELLIAEGKPSALESAFPKVSYKKISLEKLVLVEPMACTHHCVLRACQYLGLSRLDNLKVGIIGAGNTGTLIGLIAKHLGATVTLFNRSADRLEFLKQRKIFSTNELRLLSNDCSPEFDIMIPTTSFLYSSVLRFAMQAVQPMGLLLLYGGTCPGDLLLNTKIDIDQIRRQEKLINITWENKSLLIGGTYGASDEDFLKVIDLLNSAPGNFPIQHLITGEVSLDELPEKLESLAKEGYRGKLVVRMTYH